MCFFPLEWKIMNRWYIWISHLLDHRWSDEFLVMALGFSLGCGRGHGDLWHVAGGGNSETFGRGWKMKNKNKTLKFREQNATWFNVQSWIMKTVDVSGLSVVIVAISWVFDGYGWVERLLGLTCCRPRNPESQKTQMWCNKSSGTKSCTTR